MTKSRNDYSSRLRIERLSAEGIIGVHNWERNQKQTLYVTLEMWLDTRAAATNDDLANAVDYSAVASDVRELVATAQAQTIEHLAEQIAQSLLAGYAIAQINVEVHKPDAVPGTRDISIRVTRTA